MKNIFKKAVGLVITAALLMTAVFPCGCALRDAKDSDAIDETITKFFAAFDEYDQDKFEDLVEDDFLFLLGYSGDRYFDIMCALAAKTEMLEVKSIDINRDNNTAKAKLKISYIDIDNFSRSVSGYKTVSEYKDAIDEYQDREDANFTLNLTYDKDSDLWKIRRSSAEKFMELFDRTYFLNIATISGGEAANAFAEVLPAIAGGEFDSTYFDFKLSSVRVFEDQIIDDPVLLEAVEAFAKAYFGYIVDHGITIEDAPDDYFYSATLTGTAPSRTEILNYFNSDEYVIESYMYSIRMDIASNAQKYEEIVAQMYAEIYYDLAKQIPSMSGEPYSIELSVDPTEADPKVFFSGQLLPFTDVDVYNASQISNDQKVKCYQKAVENLYLAGEITQAQYEKLLSDINQIKNTTSDTYATFVTNVSWEGTENHENQAVGVYEYIPEWSDNTFYYGKSQIDSNGIFMHYSKEPDWLDTAGYCIADDGITVMVRFNRKFEKGTELVYDWYIDGENYGTTTKFTVEEDGSYIFEFTIPVLALDKYQTCEFRLWEMGHSHVISYVELTQT